MTGRSHDRSAPLDTEEAARSLNESELLVADLVLRPFVDAYRVMAEELVNLGPGHDVDERVLLEMSSRCSAMVATTPHHRGGGVWGDVCHRIEDGATPGLLGSQAGTSQAADRRPRLSPSSRVTAVDRGTGANAQGLGARVRRRQRPGVASPNHVLVIW